MTKVLRQLYDEVGGADGYVRIKDLVYNQTLFQVNNQLMRQVDNRVWDQVWRQVLIPVKYPVISEFRNF